VDCSAECSVAADDTPRNLQPARERGVLGRMNSMKRANAVNCFPDGDYDLRSTQAPKVDGRAPFAAGYLETIRSRVLSR
jgi:hypothetical protein